MKIRITGNKIRLRLKEPEVQVLNNGISIKEALLFGSHPDQQLVFLLAVGEQSGLAVAYQPGSVTISMPKAFAEMLATTSKIGFDGEVDSENNSTIYILIEKDFECLDAPEEANEGSYPNPKQVC